MDARETPKPVVTIAGQQVTLEPPAESAGDQPMESGSLQVQLEVPVEVEPEAPARTGQTEGLPAVAILLILASALALAGLIGVILARRNHPAG